MINKDSIVTAYDEHLTLVEWLQKVETALKDASAVSFNVNKRGDATLTFSVVFEDGSEIESNPIVLEQGESVQTATIRNGHLILTLTNGDELDAGDLGGVSGFSIDASQHLIVTYQNGSTQDLGAIFNGATIKVNTLTSDNEEISTLKPVIEVMTGYSFEQTTKTNITINYIYAGSCKNGNKLTLVVFCELTRTGTIQDDYFRMGNFLIPASVLSRLYPYTISDNAVLSESVVFAWASESYQPKQLFGSMHKVPTGTQIFIFNANSLEVDTRYFARFEATFLLSDNLANNG